MEPPDEARRAEFDTDPAVSIPSGTSDEETTVLSAGWRITSSATSRAPVLDELPEPAAASERDRDGVTPRGAEPVPADALTLTESVDSDAEWWLTRSRSSSEMRLLPKSIC